MNNRFIVFVLSIFLVYLVAHVLLGYTKCINSDWILCPGQLMDNDEKDDEE